MSRKTRILNLLLSGLCQKTTRTVRRRPDRFRLVLEALEARETPAFVPTDIVVLRVGDSRAALDAGGTAVFLDEYDPTTANQSAPIQSIGIPNSSLPGSLVLGGTAVTQGYITRSVDGQFIALVGYDAAVGAELSGVRERTVGVVNSAGEVSYGPPLEDQLDEPRGIASVNGCQFWYSHANGLTYLNFNENLISTTPGDVRSVGIFGVDLYVSSGVGTALDPGVLQVGSGLPRIGSQGAFSLTGLNAFNSPSTYDFFFADLSRQVEGVDTLYVADDNIDTSGGAAPGGIRKFSLVPGPFGGTWVENGVIGDATDGYRGLTGVAGFGLDGVGTVTLYAVRAGEKGGASQLVTLTDATGYDAAPDVPDITVLATAPENTAFRGVALAPRSPTAVDTTTAITSITPQTANPGAEVTFQATVTAASGAVTPNGIVEFRDGGPTGTLLAYASVTGTGAVGTATASTTTIAPGVYSNVQAFFMAGLGSVNSRSAVFGSPLTVNGPIFTSASGTTFTEGVSGSFTVTATTNPVGSPAPNITLISGSLPLGVDFTPGAGTATLSGTPEQMTAGTYTLVFEATNLIGTSTQTFTLTVNPPPVTPQIVTPDNVLVGTNQYVDFDVDVQLGVSPAPTFSLTGAPAGVQIDPITGLLSIFGPPTVPPSGSFSFTINATNSAGTGTQTFTVNVYQHTPAQIFAGNVLVERVGDGRTVYGGSSGLAAGTSAAIYFDEYSPSGDYVQTIVAPATISESISANSNGMMSLAANGRVSAYSGYAAPAGTANVATDPNVLRAAGALYPTATTDDPTPLAAYPDGSIRGATTIDGKQFFTAGAADPSVPGFAGVRYTDTRGTLAAGGEVWNHTLDTRTVGSALGQLYFGTGSGGTFNEGVGIYRSNGTEFASGAGGMADTEKVGSSESPYQFLVFDRNFNFMLDCGDRLYWVDDTFGTGGLYRADYNRDGWGPSYNILPSTTVTNLRGLSITHNDNSPSRLLATTADSIISGTERTTFSSSLVYVDDFSETAVEAAAAGLSWTVARTIGATAATAADGLQVVQYRGMSRTPEFPGANPAPGLTITAPSSAAYGTPVEIRADFTGLWGGGVFNGYVTFVLEQTDGQRTVLSSQPLSPSGPPGPYNGTFTFTTSALPPGENTIRVFMGGNQANPLVEETTTITITGGTALSLAITSNTPNPSAPGQSVDFAVVVTPETNGTTPTGTVTLFDVSGPPGAEVYTPLGTGILNNGAVTISAVPAGTGTRSIVAVYGGNGVYCGTISEAIAHVVDSGSGGETLKVVNIVPFGAPYLYGGSGGSGFEVTFNFRVNLEGGTPATTDSNDGLNIYGGDSGGVLSTRDVEILWDPTGTGDFSPANTLVQSFGPAIQGATQPGPAGDELRFNAFRTEFPRKVKFVLSGPNHVDAAQILGGGQWRIAIRGGSGSDAFLRVANLSGLDGNADGVLSTSDDFITGVTSSVPDVTVAELPQDAVVVSIGDVVRGPGQTYDIPLILSDGSNVTRVELSTFQAPVIGLPSWLSIDTSVGMNGFELNARGLPPEVGYGFEPGGTLIIKTPTGIPFSTTPGPLLLGTFRVNVAGLTNPGAAPEIGSKGVIDITVSLIEDLWGTNIPALDDDGLAVAAYTGDLAAATGVYNASDESQLQGLLAGTITGLAGYQNLDPRVIADVNTDGLVDATDFSELQAAVIGSPSVIPPLPSGAAGIAPAGADPWLYLGAMSARPGETVAVPLRMRVTDANGASVWGADYIIRFDPTRFTVSNVRTGSMLPGFLIAANVDNVTGTIRITQSGIVPVSFEYGADGEVVVFDLTVREQTQPGRSVVNLVDRLPGEGPTTGMYDQSGPLTLAPAPTSGFDDGVDGIVTVIMVDGPAPVDTARPPAFGSTARLPVSEPVWASVAPPSLLLPWLPPDVEWVVDGIWLSGGVGKRRT
jgi:hypothetical protein